MNCTYERPTITTIPANRILEMMGPVSAGSGSPGDLMPIFGDPGAGNSGGGYQIPS